MKAYYTVLIVLFTLTLGQSVYSQKDSVVERKSERRVLVEPNRFKDSTRISIIGNFSLNTVRITIVSRNGQAVMEFIPRQIPFVLKKGNLEPGRYYVRCIDKFGRIASKKMIIEGNVPPEVE